MIYLNGTDSFSEEQKPHDKSYKEKLIFKVPFNEENRPKWTVF